MQNYFDRPHSVLPYFIFLYSVVVFFFVGGSLSSLLTPQWHVIVSELLVLFGSTLFIRIIVQQAIIDTDLPTLFPGNGSLLNRLSLTSAGLSTNSFGLLLLIIPPLALFTNLLASAIAQLPFFHDSASLYVAKTAQQLPFNEPMTFVIGFIGVVLAAPFAEEFLFRGTLLPLLRQGHPTRSIHFVVLINALLFSVIHVNPFGFLSLTIVGYFLADITTRTRSIMVPMTAHAFYNFVNGVAFPFIALHWQSDDNVDLKSSELPPFETVEMIALVTSGFVLFVLWNLFHRCTKLQPFYESRISPPLET